MSQAQNIELTNYRSFANAKCRLRPFTLVVGANNSGKTNLLRAFADYSSLLLFQTKLTPHRNAPDDDTRVKIAVSGGGPLDLDQALPIYRFDPEVIGRPEAAAQASPFVRSDGEGVTQVIERLKEEGTPSFDLLIRRLQESIPEIQGITLQTVPPGGRKTIMLQESGLNDKSPLSEVSEGTRLVLALLTVLHQTASLPPLLLIEDIDRAVHPRLYERLIGIIRQIVNESAIQIIATTHNPYLMDYFQDEPEAVVIVEKENGKSTLANLDDRLRAIDWDSPTVEEMPLGQMWFSGLVGGVPALARKRKTAA